MNKLYFKYYVPSISCCTPFSRYCSVYSFVLLHYVVARIFFFFLLCVYMSCNNICITMGGQLRYLRPLWQPAIWCCTVVCIFSVIGK